MKDLLRAARDALPRGRTLPDADWRRRHRGIVLLLAAHGAALFVFAQYSGFTLAHSALEGGLLVGLAAAASLDRLPRDVRTILASLGLVAASAVLVHLSGGYIEAHFHFFVMLGVVSLYEDWTPFLVGIAFVAAHHGVVGTLDPGSVYNHPSAVEHPWRWALVHAVFVLGLSAANVVTWRLVEESRAKARRVLDATDEAILGVGADGRILLSNPAATRLTGLTTDALEGSHLRDLVQLPETTGPLHETVVHRRDGTRVPVACTVTRSDRAGDGIARTVAMHDISDRRSAEEAMARAKRNLEDFVETSAVGLHWVAEDGTILWANEADRALLGYANDEYVGHNIAEFHEDPATIADILARLKRGEIVREREARLRHKDGSARVVLIDSSVLRRDGEFVHTRCFTRDVTARKLAEEQLAATRTQLAQSEKLSALGTLVSGVAHEIRTPLTYAVNNLSILRLRLAKAQARGVDSASLADLEALTQDALDGMDRINRIVDGLRRFAQTPPGERGPAHLSEVVARAADIFQATHKGRARMVAHYGPDTPVVLDRVRIQQVVLNLLQNAAEAMPDGGTVTLRTQATPEGAELAVTDEGSGVPPDVQGRIFDPFQTTKRNGLGLGLSIVKRVVDDHGGAIRFETSPKGTTFVVVIPIPPASRTGASAAATPA